MIGAFPAYEREVSTARLGKRTVEIESLTPRRQGPERDEARRAAEERVYQVFAGHLRAEGGQR